MFLCLNTNKLQKKVTLYKSYKKSLILFMLSFYINFYFLHELLCLSYDFYYLKRNYNINKKGKKNCSQVKNYFKKSFLIKLNVKEKLKKC